jgi:hypothetical protein
MDNINHQSDVLINILEKRKHTVGCEIGIHTGDTTLNLLEKLPSIKIYHAIDPWQSYVKYDGSIYRKPGHKKLSKWDDAYNFFMKRTKKYRKKLKIHKMKSVEAVKKIDDESLDWVFIDANHEYEYIKENLEIWIPKVKKSGIISGHDYGGKWTGIKKAVDEFVPIDTTLNVEPFYVWWFIKNE